MGRKQQEPIRKVMLADGSTRWRCVVDVGRSRDGRRRQSTRTFVTMKEAKAFVSSTRVLVTSGTYVAPSETTVGEYLEQWLEARRHSIRPKTHEGYRIAMARAIAAFGNQRLDRLAKVHLIELVDEMRSGVRPMAPRSVNLTLGVLRQAFNAAIREGLLVRNPAALVDLLPEPTEEMAAWTAEEASAFLAATRAHLWAGPYALSLSGLRRGEVLGARWSDVTLEDPNPSVAIRRSRVQLGHAGGGVSEGEPKSARSRRTVPLAPYAVDALVATRALQERHREILGSAYGEDNFVCANELGQPPRPETYSDVFYRISKAAGLRRIRLHDLRHTSVTLMLGAGIPVHVVASVHGHDPVITQRIYAHTQTGDAVAAMSALDKLLRRDTAEGL